MEEILEVKNGLTYSIINGINAGLKTGIYREYSEDGEGFYKNGKLDGTRIIYFPDDLYSQSRIEIEYLAGEIISEKHYGPEGELTYSIKY